MRTLLLSFVCILAIGTSQAQTPITLSNSNMPSAGDTLRFTSINLNSLGNYTQTGVNYNWDFSAVSSSTQGVRAFVSSLQTPYSIFFLSFTGSAEKMPDVTLGAGIGFTNYYNFYKKQSSPSQAYIADGVGMSFSNVPLPCYYTDKDELYKFPLTYPNYDSTTFKFTTPSTSVIPIVYTKVGYRITSVDGWGTVQTPYGTENCLRVVTTQYGMDSIKNSIIPIPLGFPNYMRSYQWLTTNSKIPYFEVNGSVVGSNFIPSSARYCGYQKTIPNPVGIGQVQEENPIVVYPNPVGELLRLRGGLALKDAVIYDLNGKRVQAAEPQRTEEGISLDVSTLAPGIYAIQVSTVSGNWQLRFVKE